MTEKDMRTSLSEPREDERKRWASGVRDVIQFSSLWQIAPVGFLIRAFSLDSSAGCQS